MNILQIAAIGIIAAVLITLLKETKPELAIMLGVALVMVPIVLIYQFWAYRLFSHKLDPEQVMSDSHSY